jgi:hypothetical protein
MGHHRAPSLGHDVGMGDARLVAGLLDEGDDVVGVLLLGVVHRRVEVRLRAVVVDAEPTAHVDQRGGRSHLVEAHEDPARLAQRVLVGADRRDLRADVEVEHLEAVEHVLGAQSLDRIDDLDSGQAELRAVAGGFDPLARPLGEQARPDAEVGTDAELARGLDHQLDLAETVDHDDRRAPEPLSEQRRLDVRPILVAVADDERLRGVQQGEGDQQLRLAPRLEPHLPGRAVLDDLLDDVALLVDLDGVDAPVAAPVLVGGDCLIEGVAQALHTAGENVREADQQRRPQPPVLEVPDQIEQVDAGSRLAAAVARVGLAARPGRPILHLARPHLDAALGVDAEEARAPAGDVEELEAVANRPAAHGARASCEEERPILGVPRAGRSAAAPFRPAQLAIGSLVCSPDWRSRTSTSPRATSSGPSR